MKISSPDILTLHEHLVFTLHRYGIPCAKTTTRNDIKTIVNSTCFIISIIILLARVNCNNSIIFYQFPFLDGMITLLHVSHFRCWTYIKSVISVIEAVSRWTGNEPRLLSPTAIGGILSMLDDEFVLMSVSVSSYDLWIPITLKFVPLSCILKPELLEGVRCSFRDSDLSPFPRVKRLFFLFVEMKRALL